MDEPRPLLEHLDELRSRLFRLIGAWLGCSLVAGVWHKDVFELLMGPAVSALRQKGYCHLELGRPARSRSRVHGADR